MHTEEIPLDGGNASGGVARVGDTVRKPWTGSTPAVSEFVTRIAERGIDVPRPLGRDDRGRQIIEFVPGTLAMHRGPLTLVELGRVGRLVRAIHDASVGFEPSEDARWDALLPVPDADLICHNDLAPWNLIVGERWVFIDWDGAGPSTRLWDLAYAAQAFTLNDSSEPPEMAGRRLAAFVDGYHADRELRADLPHAMGERAAAMHELLRTSHASGREPWATMYVEGHGDHWLRAAEYVREHRTVWEAALVPHGRPSS